MDCEETNKLLSQYLDDILPLPTRVAVDVHLDRCPVCRAEVASFRALSRSLVNLARPTVPSDLVSGITNALRIEVAAQRLSPKPGFLQLLQAWVQPRLMPFGVGSLASVVLFVLMFAGFRPHFAALNEAVQQNRGAFALANGGYDLNQPVTPEGFSASRAPFSGQSPSLNPAGALAVLTSAYARPRPDVYEDADDMIVVADVFSNGTAALTDVVQAPRNRRMLDDFELALRESTAFVPASLDRRPDTMRVVFTVQKVDVRGTDF